VRPQHIRYSAHVPNQKRMLNSILRVVMLTESKVPEMKSALRCISVIVALSAGPAVAQTWVTVAMLPHSTLSDHYLAYQIDLESIVKRGAFTYARGKHEYKLKGELVMAECSKERLMLAADRTSFPPPYWRRRSNGAWFYDDPDSSIRGQRFDTGPDAYVFRSWMSGIFDFVCSR
jgi:hypothetical protein